MDPAAMKTKLNVKLTDAFNWTSFDIISVHTGDLLYMMHCWSLKLILLQKKHNPVCS